MWRAGRLIVELRFHRSIGPLDKYIPVECERVMLIGINVFVFLTSCTEPLNLCRCYLYTLLGNVIPSLNLKSDNHYSTLYTGNMRITLPTEHFRMIKADVVSNYHTPRWI